MNRNEAYETMIRGEKIRNKKWIVGGHAFYRDGKFIFCKDGYEAGTGACMNWVDGYDIYQEPKPVRALRAFEHGNGTITLRYCDKTNDLDYSSNYRKLSDEELKELFSFLKD